MIFYFSWSMDLDTHRSESEYIQLLLSLAPSTSLALPLSILFWSFLIILSMGNQDEYQEESLHIVMVPWLAFGHLTPFLELSKCLAAQGHRISFISTPRNLQRLPKVPPNLSHPRLLNFVSFPLPHVDNLPAEAESTIDLPVDQVPYLKKAYDGLEGPVSNFLESSTPDWIICDFAPHWLPAIASKLGVPCVFFSTMNAPVNCFFGPPSSLVDYEDLSRTKPEDFTIPPKWIPFPNNLAFRLHEIRKLFSSLEPNVSGVSDTYRFASIIQGCEVVAIRSCREFESEWLGLLQDKIFQKLILPVGILPSLPVQDAIGEDKNEEWIGISEWLDKREKGSVVYIALGTEATLSPEELTELALGLELSKFHFFWVLRKPACSTIQDPTAVLPDGFQDRTRDQGFVCMTWAPQLKILRHPSVGGFLTHCGWSSIIEGLSVGCPLILLPVQNDQALNARILEWKKIGLEIVRDEEDGSFTKEAVAKAVKMVVVEEEGEVYRANARELRGIFGDKERHDRYIGDFASYLKEHRRGHRQIRERRS